MSGEHADADRSTRTDRSLRPAAILAVAAVYFDRTSRRYSRAELVLVGVLWVPFEFVIGSLDGIPPEETLAQYDVTAGEAWIAVPLALLVAPVLFGSLLRDDRARRSTASREAVARDPPLRVV